MGIGVKKLPLFKRLRRGYKGTKVKRREGGEGLREIR